MLVRHASLLAALSAVFLCSASSLAAEPRAESTPAGPVLLLTPEDEALLQQTIEAVRASNDDARQVAEILERWAQPSDNAPVASPPRRSGRRARRVKSSVALTPLVSDQAFERLMSSRRAYQTKLSIIANNLANSDTVGFKRNRVVMEDQPYRYDRLPGAMDSGGNLAATGVMVGMGVRVSGVRTDFSQGPLQDVGDELSVAIVGRGFFSVQDPGTGMNVYTRAGNFSRNSNGDLVLGSAATGRLLEPSISIPEDAMDILISAEGHVAVHQPGTTSLTQVGMIELTTFVNPEGLLRLGENLLSETEASGRPHTGTPGQTGIGTLAQGYLESSNVDPDEETLRWDRTVRMVRRLERLMGE